MDFNFPQNLEYCRAYVEQFSGLLFYSHVPVAIIALILGLYTFVKSGRSLLSKIFLSISIAFISWTVLDLILWLGYAKSSLIMATWAPIEIFSVSLFVLCFWFTYVFANKKNLPLWLQIILFVPVLSLIIITPTIYNLEYFDLQECYAVESSLYITYFSYIKFVLAIITVGYLILAYFRAKDRMRRQILILGVGMGAFLYTFLISGYIANTTENYRLEMYGLFAMIIFMSVLVYLIVKFKTFDIKLIGSQALIVALVILIGAQFAYIRTNTNIILTSVSLVLTGFIGINLIRSISREVLLREQLQIANEGQANLLHILNHQIKGYLTKARYIFDDLIGDGGYGLSENAIPLVKQGYDSVTEGVNFVTDFLNASNIEKGSYQYKSESLNFKDIVAENADKQKESATQKGLSFEVSLDEGDYNMKGDKEQLNQAVRNLIDNSIKYTPKGSIKLRLSTKNSKILFTIQDTGVGISNELKPKLFTKGGRDRDSLKININSTGFGLAFVKGVVEAHKGRVWAESPGVNQGSTFYMELPLV